MIKEIIGKNFKNFVKKKKVVVEGLIFESEIVMRIGFLDENNGIKQVNFEASTEYSIQSNNIMNQIYFCVDALGAMIDQYIKADEDIELPTLWTKFDIDGKAVYLQTSTENTDLETAANDLLNENNGLDEE